MPFWAQAQSLSLEQAVGLARANRASVQAAQLRLEQARLAGKALGTFSSTSLQIGYSTDVNVGGTDGDLVISQPIDIGGRRSAGRLTGQAGILLAEANLRQTLGELQSEVVSLYVGAVAANQRLRIAAEAEDSASRLLGAVKSLVEGGKLPGVQATRVSIELDRARGVRKQRAADLAASVRRLSAATGFDGSLSVGDFPQLVAEDITEAELESQRSELLVLAAETAAAEAEVRTAKLDRRPQLELQARRSPWQYTSPVYGARIQLSFPLSDAGRSRAEEGAANKRAEASRRSLSDGLTIAKAELEAEKLEIGGAQGQITDLESALASGRDLIARTQTGLKEGANTLIDVLDALRAVREIEEALVGARETLATAQAHYLKATGSLLEVRP